MTELISPTPATTIQPQATKADKENTQELPVAQQKASDVIQNTGPEGEGLYDSATGERMLSTEQQIIEQGRVGDRVTPALAAELQAFADGR